MLLGPSAERSETLSSTLTRAGALAYAMHTMCGMATHQKRFVTQNTLNARVEQSRPLEIFCQITSGWSIILSTLEVFILSSRSAPHKLVLLIKDVTTSSFHSPTQW